MEKALLDSLDRRSFIVAATSIALAGCSSEGEPTPDTDSSGGSGETNTDAEAQTSSKTETTTASTNQNASITVGEIVGDDSLAMVVREVEKTTKLGEFQEADSGNTYVVVRMAVKNKSSSEFVSFNSFWQTRLKDDANHVYNQTIAVTESPMQNGQLAPGEVSRGDIVFEVPEGASGLSLQFDFSSFELFSFNRVVVDLESEASQVANLSQNLATDIHSSGDTVSKENIAVTLHGTRTETELDSFTSAEEGNQYVIPDISVENRTGEPLSVSIALQMVVKDGTGRAYTVDIGGLSALDQSFAQGSELAAGETRRGEVAYQVPKSASKLFFAFEFSLLADGDKTFWSLSG